ncbi:MAG: hypothetical protein ACYC3I_21035 [Gemmataceae bacterium]
MNLDYHLLMPRRTSLSTAFPPFYVLRAGESCPKCGQGTNVYGLLSFGLYDKPQDERFDGPLLLNHIERLPQRILNLLTQRCPGWRFDCEKPSEPSYLMNHCLHCDAPLSDFYTHGEPGSAFYPTSPDECWNISVFQLPVEDDMAVDCSFSAGGLTDWLDFDRAKPWETPAAA